MAAEVLGWHRARLGAVWAQGRGGSCPGPRHTVTHTSHCSAGWRWGHQGLAGKGDSLILPSHAGPGQIPHLKCWALPPLPPPAGPCSPCAAQLAGTAGSSVPSFPGGGEGIKPGPGAGGMRRAGCEAGGSWGSLGSQPRSGTSPWWKGAGSQQLEPRSRIGKQLESAAWQPHSHPRRAPSELPFCSSG